MILEPIDRATDHPPTVDNHTLVLGVRCVLGKFQGPHWLQIEPRKSLHRLAPLTLQVGFVDMSSVKL